MELLGMMQWIVGMERDWNCFNCVERSYDGNAVVNDVVVKDDAVVDVVVNCSNAEAIKMLSGTEGAGNKIWQQQ